MTNIVGPAISVALIASTAAKSSSFDSAGTQIHYTVSGAGDPVVLIHGFIGSRDEWLSPPPYFPPEAQEKFEPLFSVLARDYNAITFDCRGHGESGKPKGIGDYGAEMARDVVRLLDHLKIQRAHIVGYSMGASVAAKLVDLHPERVTSVVLGGGGAVLEGSEQLAFMESVGASLERGRGVEPIILGLRPPSAPAPSEEELVETNKMFLAHQDEAALAQVAFGHRDLTVSKLALLSNTVPVLLVVGGEDPLRPSAEETKRYMSKSQLIVVEGHDHVSTELSPEFFDAATRFIAQHTQAEQ